MFHSRRFFRTLTFCSLLIAACASPLWAQIRPALTLTIAVKDGSGATIPDASIVLTRGNEVRKVTSGQDGTAKISDMLTGEWTLTVRRDAFTPVQRQVIMQGASLDIAVTLEIAPVEQNLLVQAAPAVASPNPLDVSASRSSFLDVTVRDLPYTLTVVTQERMQERGVTNLLDALELAPGVTAWADTGYIPAVDIRGLSTTDAGIFIAREGIVQNSVPQAGRNIDSFLLQSVEVLKGPSSFSFGSGVAGASINTKTKDPRRELGVESLLAYESFGRTRVGLGFNVPLTKNLAGRIDFSQNYGGSNLQRSDSTMRAFNTGLLWTPIPKVTIKAKGITTSDDLSPYFSTPILNSQLDPSVAYIELAPNTFLDPRTRGLNYNRANPKNKGRNTFGVVETNVELPYGWQLRNIYSRSAVRLDALNSEGISFNQTTLNVTPSGYFFNKKRDDQTVDQLDLRNTLRILGRSVSFAVGGMADYNYQRRHAAAGGAGATPAMNYLNPIAYDPANSNTVRSADINTDTKAGYYELMARLTNKLTFSGGQRIDHIRNNRYTYSTDTSNLVSFHALTGRAALIYALTPTVNVYISRSNAIQPTGTGTNSTGATALVGITQTQAQFVLQRSRSWEGGVKATTWRNRVEGTLSYFNTRKYDMLTQELVDGVTVIERTGKVVSQGIETSFIARPTRMFSLQGDFVYNDAHYLVFHTVVSGVPVDRSGNKMTRVPTVKWSVTPTLRIGPVTGNISFNTRGASWADNSNTQRLRPYTLVNSNISVTLSPGTVLTLTGRNLTDAVTVNRGGIVPGATTARISLPRNYGMQLTKSFL